ncbi:tripartite tricarboxylate transporter substrate binding protein [Bordetella petrii]|uniref:tripartite tricarboxylate transporter substrate binding protein n=1 Tax=Bordetella petrii TaxID=94624 RepID=UPI001A95A2FD|nr:tripartite tricarboxylate transporter substrate binding protein [Bordetella petrii]MBO1114213.1 tripartite tricarboxylate transporter substrate binding protein [Bordetella petrii]
MTMRLLALAALAAGAACAAGPRPAAAAYPEKPIRVVVPLAPGGTVDLVSRLIAKGLSEELKQSVIVENKPGASGLIGTRDVAHAEPDGYTLLAVANTFVSAPAFVPNAGYDPLKDFAPVTQTCQIPMVLVAHPAVPQHTVKALIERARAQPGEVSFASSGIGSTGYIAAELFSRQAGIEMLGVAYKGNGQALTDVVGGQVMTMFDQVSTSSPYIKSGKLRALAVTTATRSVLLPDVPTIAESGLPGYEDVTFNAILAPAGTPAPIVAQLHQAIGRVLAQPALREQLAGQGIEVKVSGSPQAFGDYLKQAAQKYRGIAQGRPAGT